MADSDDLVAALDRFIHVNKPYRKPFDPTCCPRAATPQSTTQLCVDAERAKTMVSDHELEH
jgi:hypothetical protein